MGNIPRSAESATHASTSGVTPVTSVFLKKSHGVRYMGCDVPDILTNLGGTVGFLLTKLGSPSRLYSGILTVTGR